jgi:hypothetical protein
MFAALPSISASLAAEQDQVSQRPTVAYDNAQVVETRLWLEEHQWLMELMQHPINASPKFRMPDLISACVSLVLIRSFGVLDLFRYLGTELVLRPPRTPRRKESMWRAQYAVLLSIQRSAANQHPNPKFQLDQLTTGCVALARKKPEATYNVLHQARLNMADRTGHWSSPKNSVEQAPDTSMRSGSGEQV